MQDLNGARKSEVVIPAEPPQLFSDAVREFAHSIGVDPDAMVAGEKFQANGLGMWLRHFGKKDPDGALLVIDMGQYPEADPEPFLRFAMEQNLNTPAALHGYYALVPGTRTLVLCVRLDLARTQNGAIALALAISTLVRSLDFLRDKMGDAAEEILNGPGPNPASSLMA
jgi:hypothetical protein